MREEATRTTGDARAPSTIAGLLERAQYLNGEMRDLRNRISTLRDCLEHGGDPARKLSASAGGEPKAVPSSPIDRADMEMQEALASIETINRLLNTIEGRVG